MSARSAFAATLIAATTLGGPAAFAQAPDQFSIAERIRAGRAKASAYAQPPLDPGYYPGGGPMMLLPPPPPTLDISAGDVSLSLPVGGVQTGQGLIADTVNIIVNVQNGDNNVASNTVTLEQTAP